MSTKIKIAVSSCLAGHKVRYDGNHKNNNVILQLCEKFDCIAVCPESEIGLGVPRPALNIVRINNSLRARGKTNPLFDVTDRLFQHANQIVAKHKDMCGYIFKSRSPSCGVNSTPWFELTVHGKKNKNGVANGIFSSQIIQLLPELPIIEETHLEDSEIFNKFVEDVFQYADKKIDVK